MKRINKKVNSNKDGGTKNGNKTNNNNFKSVENNKTKSKDTENNNKDNGESKEIPRFLKQNFIYPIGSIEGRPSAHGSNVIAADPEHIRENGEDKIKQTLFSTWFCGTREGNEDVAIMFSKIEYSVQKDVLKLNSTDELSINYSEPRVIADMPGKALGNPVLFLDKSRGILHLWFTRFKPRSGRERDIMHQQSSDLGKTWSKAVIFSDRQGLWCRNNILVLKNGNWLFPLNDETTFNKKYKTYWSSRFALSKDKGRSWEFSELYSIKKGMIQPTVVELDDNHLYCLNRSRCRRIVEMESFDGGVNWSTPKKTRLPNPNSNVCLVKSGKDGLILCYNPVKSGRTPLSIAQSLDNGKNWKRLFDLQNIKGEFSYPCLIQTQDGLYHVVYTFRRQTISHDIFIL